jgi:hypothetical protein
MYCFLLCLLTLSFCNSVSFPTYSPVTSLCSLPYTLLFPHPCLPTCSSNPMMPPVFPPALLCTLHHVCSPLFHSFLSSHLYDNVCVLHSTFSALFSVLPSLCNPLCTLLYAGPCFSCLYLAFSCRLPLSRAFFVVLALSSSPSILNF